MSEPKYTYKSPVTMDVEIFNPILFKVGAQVILQIYTSDWEKMYWREEYGIVNKYDDTCLQVLVIPRDNGEPEYRTVLLRHLDDRFNIVPVKQLIEELQEELDAK